MKVKDIMRTNFLAITKGSTYREVAEVLIKNNKTSAPVMDNKGNLIGFVSEKDLFRILFPFYKSYYANPELYMNGESRESKASEIKDHPVEEFMDPDVIVTTPDTLAMDAGAKMIAHKVHKLPVVEDGKIVGIISREDILRAIFKDNFGF